jgi:HD-like signal output (HDOD) protein
MRSEHVTTDVDRESTLSRIGARFPRPGSDGAVVATSRHHRSVLVVGPHQALADHVRSATTYIPGTWDVLVAPDGTFAGRVLGSKPIHAAVVGLEPALGGIAFLDWMRRHHPQVTRVAAFPNDNADHNLRAANAAHVYVEPTTRERDLGHLIGRTVGLQARLGTETLIAFAGSLQRIPSIPRVYAELRAVMSDPDFDLGAVTNVLQRDPGLVVKVLQVVNSAFYGLRQRISDLHHAVALMGSNTISSLVLGISLHDQFSVLGAARRALDEEWHRALAVADAAKRIAEAERVSPELVEEAYLAGLLHNVGRLVLASNLSDRFTAIEWPEDRSEVIAIERSAFGAGHPELGGLLLGTWGLDDSLVEAVAFYAEPARSLGTQFSPLTALHVAVGLSPGTHGFINEAYLESLGLPVDAGHRHD